MQHLLTPEKLHRAQLGAKSNVITYSDTRSSVSDSTKYRGSALKKLKE